MTTHFRLSKYRAVKNIALLLVSVSSLCALPGCSYFGLSNPFSNDRPPQVLVGGRRPPILNAVQPDTSADIVTPAPATTTHAASSHVRKPIPGNPGQPTTLGAMSDSSLAAPAPTISPDDMHTPDLSSVPPTPPQLREERETRQQQAEELQAEQARAQREKALLMAEPSQQQETVTEPPVVKHTPVVTEPAPVMPMPKPVVTPVPLTSAPSTPTPQRGVDIMTQAQWDAMQKAKQETLSALPSQSVPAPTAPAPSAFDVIPAPAGDAPAPTEPTTQSIPDNQ